MDYHLIDDPCKTEANLLYSNLNDYIYERPEYEAEVSSNNEYTSVFHISNAFFVPNGEYVITPNFVSETTKIDCRTIRLTKTELKKNAKNTLLHWTKEKVKIKVSSQNLQKFPEKVS